VNGYPFEVRVPSGSEVSGAVLADHVKCLDWRARSASFACRLPPQTVVEVVLKLERLL